MHDIPGMHRSAHLPGGEVEKFGEAERSEFFGWGESWDSSSIHDATPFAPPEKILRVRSLSLPDLRICFDLHVGEVDRTD